MKSIGTTACLILAIFVASAEAQVLRVAEMTSTEIAALDRDRTVVLLVGGILEQHGPYLPSFTDGYKNEWVANEIAEAIVAQPGRTVLLFPTIPLGTGGANEIGRRYVFPGTYAVSSTTLRAIFMDLGDELGEQGFRSIFIVHGHGAPNHSRALDDAGDYFRATYGGYMIHLLGRTAVHAPNPLIDEPIRKQEGFSPHAGVEETSLMLFLRPRLVTPSYKSAPDLRGETWSALVSVAKEREWPGYFGAPRLATAPIGAAEAKGEAERATRLALQILGGADEREFERFSVVVTRSEENRRIDRDALEREARMRERQQRWLEARPSDD